MRFWTAARESCSSRAPLTRWPAGRFWCCRGWLRTCGRNSLEELGGFNLYVFALNDAVNGFDFFGLDGSDDCSKKKADDGWKKEDLEGFEKDYNKESGSGRARKTFHKKVPGQGLEELKKAQDQRPDDIESIKKAEQKDQVELEAEAQRVLEERKAA